MFNPIDTIPLHDKSNQFEYEIIDYKYYAGFMQRFCANLIDGIILSIVSFLVLFFRDINVTLFITLTIFSFFISIFYNVYFLKNYGATYGKSLMDIKVVKLNGEKIDWKESILRNIVEIIVSMFQTIIILICVFSISSKEFMTVVNEGGNFTKSINLDLNLYFEYLLLFWCLSELIFILFNKQRRAIHDYIAGTVVIYKHYEDEFIEINKPK